MLEVLLKLFSDMSPLAFSRCFKSRSSRDSSEKELCFSVSSRSSSAISTSCFGFCQVFMLM